MRRCNTEVNMSTIIKRQDVKRENTWALEDMFASDEQWEHELAQLNSLIEKLPAYEGHLTESADKLYEYLTLSEQAEKSLERVYVYANQSMHVDMNNSKYQDYAAKANNSLTQIKSATAFFTPEILAADESVINTFIQEKSELKVYQVMFERIFKTKPHTLSKAEETLLAEASEVLDAAGDIFALFNNADLKFDKIQGEDGQPTDMSNGRYISFLSSPNRDVRKAAFMSMYKAFGQFKNTLASTYNANAKKASFYAKTRHYASSVEASLKPKNISVDVYDTLIETIHTHLPKFYRYMSLRKKVMGLDELHMYDLHTPMIANVDKKISFDEAKAIVLEALKPMGAEYISHLEEGFNNRWIDIYENEGKRSGAYSWGAYGTHPYVLLNHNDDLNSMFTLAHEMGHALHTYYSNKTQPYTYAGYELFVAEVASTCNESLLIQHLLKNSTDNKERAYLITHFLDSIKSTILRQTMFAEFEKITHGMTDNGESLNADKLCDIYYDLNKLYFGPDVYVDEEIKYEWARIPHFYSEFYVYQYATGFSAAIALSKRILDLGDAGVADYMKFLTGGSSKYPIDLLKDAGVDMSTPEPINAAMELFEEMLDELETLV